MYAGSNRSLDIPRFILDWLRDYLVGVTVLSSNEEAKKEESKTKLAKIQSFLGPNLRFLEETVRRLTTVCLDERNSIIPISPGEGTLRGRKCANRDWYQPCLPSTGGNEETL